MFDLCLAVWGALPCAARRRLVASRSRKPPARPPEAPRPASDRPPPGQVSDDEEANAQAARRAGPWHLFSTCVSWLLTVAAAVGDAARSHLARSSIRPRPRS